MEDPLSGLVGLAAFHVAGDFPQRVILLRRWLLGEHVRELLQIIGSASETVDDVLDYGASTLAATAVLHLV